MKLRKYLALLLILPLSFSLVACNENHEDKGIFDRKHKDNHEDKGLFDRKHNKDKGLFKRKHKSEHEDDEVDEHDDHD